MEKVVKCNRCGQYFMRTEKNTKCPFPFCKTEYVEVAAPGEPRSEEREEKSEDKKGTARTQKKSFKIWKNN